MSDKTLKLLFCMIFLLTILPFISAIPPVQTTISDNTLQIAYPQYQYAQINQNFTLNIHVFNTSQYITGATANCFLDLYSPNGTEILHSSMTAGTTDYHILITQGNFSNLGVHSFVIQCNTTAQTGFANGVFEVTNKGIELTISKALVDLGLLLILLIFFAVSIFVLFNTENILARVGSVGLSYLFLIAITFISWNLANDFLTSTPFIAEMFRIVFFVLIVGAFPLLIGGFIWYFLMLWKIKEIERLMSKGISYDEAERRQGKKYK